MNLETLITKKEWHNYSFDMKFRCIDTLGLSQKTANQYIVKLLNLADTINFASKINENLIKDTLNFFNLEECFELPPKNRKQLKLEWDKWQLTIKSDRKTFNTNKKTKDYVFYLGFNLLDKEMSRNQFFSNCYDLTVLVYEADNSKLEQIREIINDCFWLRCLEEHINTRIPTEYHKAPIEQRLKFIQYLDLISSTPELKENMKFLITDWLENNK